MAVSARTWDDPLSKLVLTVGRDTAGRKLAVISIEATGHKTVLDLEIVDGWGRKRIDEWFRRMSVERPWETRQ